MKTQHWLNKHGVSAQSNAGEVGVKRSGWSHTVFDLIGPGDWTILLAGGLLVAWLAVFGHEGGDQVVIKQAGRVFLETSPRLDQVVTVPGPLGETQVEIQGGRVRVKADPSPRQLCVRQGWLEPGETAVCLPNRVSVEWGKARYDSLNY